MRTTFSWAYGDMPLTGSYGNHDGAVLVILQLFFQLELVFLWVA